MGITITNSGQGSVVRFRNLGRGGVMTSTKLEPIVRSGLIMYLNAGNSASYPGTGTTWFDISGAGNNATIFNSPTFSTLNGGNFIMNGTNNYITPSTSVNVTNTTQTIWYKWNGINQASILSFLGNPSVSGYGMYMNNGTNTPTVGNKISGLIPFNSYNGAGVTSALSSINWSQITMIRNVSAASMQWYINGVYNAGGNPFTINPDVVLPFILGNATSPFAAGNLAIVMYYNIALSAAEVLQNYNTHKSTFGL